MDKFPDAAAAANANAMDDSDFEGFDPDNLYTDMDTIIRILSEDPKPSVNSFLPHLISRFTIIFIGSGRLWVRVPSWSPPSMADPTKPAASFVAASDRGYWLFRKSDFFPERSFRNWSAYTSAVSATGPRLRDRLFHCSTDDDEINALCLRSEHDMKHCLTWWDLIWIGFGSVVGTGIFVLTGQEAHESAGPTIILSYTAAGLSALLSIFCYTEFAVEIPVAGSSFFYLRVELGEFIAFIVAANILLEAIIGDAGLACSWTSYFVTLINRDPDSHRIYAHGLAEGFNLLNPLASIVLITCSTLGTRSTSTLNWITSILSVATIAFIIVTDSAHVDPANLTPFFPMGDKRHL